MGSRSRVSIPVSAATPVEDVIAARGSQRRMNPDRGLPLDVVRACMTVALRGVPVPHWIAAHNVEGLAPGLYRWSDLRSPLRSGTMREELRRICLGQAQGGDAAFVAIAAINVACLSDQQYREAQLAAGLAEGRLHLAAYALGASATGMTFRDGEIPGGSVRPRGHTHKRSPKQFCRHDTGSSVGNPRVRR